MEDDAIDISVEDSLRKIGKLQASRVQNSIVIVVDERDDFKANLPLFDVGMAPFDEGVTLLRIPGMQFGTVLTFLSVNPYFGKGTIWVFLAGIHELVLQNLLPECLKFGCPDPQVLLSARPCHYDSSYLVLNAVQLNLNILLNTENDIALFCRLLPVRINHYNKFTMTNRNCFPMHRANSIRMNSIQYSLYSKTVQEYNNFVKLHAESLGYSPWRLDLPIHRGKKIHFSNLLDLNGYNIIWSNDLKKEYRLRQLCKELLVTASLTQVERRRAILIHGIDLRIINNEDLKDYFGVFGEIERTCIYSSNNIVFPIGFGMVLFTGVCMVNTVHFVGSKIHIKGMKLLVTRVKYCLTVSKDLEAEVQNDETICQYLKGDFAMHPVTGTPWNVGWKEDGRFYFHNYITGESVWERPAALLDYPEVDKLINTPPPEVAALISVVPKSTDFEPSSGNLKYRIVISSIISATTQVEKRRQHSSSSPSSSPMPISLSDLRLQSINNEKIFVSFDDLLMQQRALIQKELKDDEKQLENQPTRKTTMVKTDILKHKKLRANEYKFKKKPLKLQMEDVGSLVQGQRVSKDNSSFKIMENKTESSKYLRENCIDSKIGINKKNDHIKVKVEKESAGLKRPEDFTATYFPPKKKIKTLSNNHQEKKNQSIGLESLFPLDEREVNNGSTMATFTSSLFQSEERKAKRKCNSSPLQNQMKEFFKSCEEKSIASRLIEASCDNSTDFPTCNCSQFNHNPEGATENVIDSCRKRSEVWKNNALQEEMHQKSGQVKDLVVNSNEIFKTLDDTEINFKCYLNRTRLKSDTNDPINSETQPVTLPHSSQNIKGPKIQTECLNSVKVKMEFTSIKQENNCEIDRESDFDNCCVSPIQEVGLVKEEGSLDLNTESNLKDCKISFDDHLTNILNPVKVECVDEDSDDCVEIISGTFDDHLRQSENNYLNSNKVKMELPSIKTEKNETLMVQDNDLNMSSLQELIRLDYIVNALEDSNIKSEKEFFDSNTNIRNSPSAANQHSDKSDPCCTKLVRKFIQEYVQELRKLKQEFEDEYMNFKRKPELHPTYSRYREMFVALYSTAQKGRNEDQVREALWNQFWDKKLEGIKKEVWQLWYQNFTEEFAKRIDDHKSEVLKCLKNLFLKCKIKL